MKISVLWSVCCLALCGLGLGETLAQDNKPKDDGVRWMDVKELGLEGQGWTDTKAPYDRLPARAEGKVRDAVWSLSRHSAGLCVRFVTDSPKIHARWTVTSANLAMPHMAATGVSGVDLYARDDRGQWRWVAVGQPKAATNDIVLAQGLRPGKREYLVYLPLYNGTASAEIGVPQEFGLEKAPAYPPERAKPIVYYGTSITHVPAHRGPAWSTPPFCSAATTARRSTWASRATAAWNPKSANSSSNSIPPSTSSTAART